MISTPSTSHVDLLIGSHLGRWAIDFFSPHQIRQVVADTPELAAEAEGRGFSVGSLRNGRAALALHWRPILRPSELGLYSRLWNVHPGLLPRARGMYPVFWSVYLKEPAGATVHQMIREVDLGPIFLQEKVPFGDFETAGQVRARVFEAEKRLAESALNLIASDDLPPVVHTAELPGVVRTLAMFLQLRDNPPLEEMQHNQIRRLILALTDKEYVLPAWADSYP
jgi:methionyl-tRNA formyltransferase